MSLEMEQFLSVDYNRQRKSTLKGMLTKFVHSVNKFSDGGNLSELKSKLVKQDRESIEFDKVITVLLNAMGEANEHEALCAEADEFNHTYVTARSEALQFLGLAPQDVRPLQAIHYTSKASTDVPAQIHCHSARLQPIPLPKFSGQLDKWPEFAHLFKSLVIDSTSLSNVEKLMHLKSCLSGDATKVVTEISSLETNFDVAWNLLKTQFDNPKLLIEEHLKALFSLPKVNSNDANTIRDHLTKFHSHCDALKAVKGLTINNLLIQFSLIKLDEVTREKWEEYSYKLEEPTFDNVIEFLTQRSHIKTAASRSFITKPFIKSVHNKASNYQTHIALDNTKSFKCNFCSDNHRIYDCAAFLKLSHRERYESIISKKLCINCLGNAHHIKQCSSKRSCFKCHKRHNTLLHEVTVQTLAQDPRHSQQNEVVSQAGTSTSFTTCLPSGNTQAQVLLSTALVDIEDYNGQRRTVRALLDNGSQPHIVTEKLVQLLGLPFTESHARIAGIGTAATAVKGIVPLNLISKHNQYRAQIVATIIDKITHDVPSSSIDYTKLNLPQNLKLADPQFGTPGPIDLIIGADLFFHLLCPGKIINANGPTLQDTEFGWIISGRFPTPYAPHHARSFHVKVIDTIDIQLRKFWEIESVDAPSDMKSRDYCEKHFCETVARDKSGRFIVKLPFNPLKDELGTSVEMAAKRLAGIETRLSRNSDLKVAYTEFMREYETLGHMTKCDTSNQGYFIPHHAVIRENSLSTKCRCVYDASAKTSTGVSLNDTLHVGPVIQDDILTILTRFRIHPIVFTADIEKMYRQIRVADEDQVYQKILWHSTPTAPISIYKLNTITYGTSCAPFLATRCLKELALQVQQSNPCAARIILNDFYVDDCITGCASVSEAINLKGELTSVLNSAGLPLQKWRSNVPELMTEGTSALVLNKSTMNTLGLSWDHLQDSLLFLPTSVTHDDDKITKRTILSDVARLFDPLGLMGPVVVVAKLLLQRLWKLNCSWDQVVPTGMHAEWIDYRAGLSKISSICIPRCMYHEFLKFDDTQWPQLEFAHPLEAAEIEQQHPIILPSHNLLTDLIVNYEHLRYLHAGQQSILASLRMRYWPLSGKSTVRKILRRCVLCCRARPTPMQYLMGDLPERRVIPSRPFSSCGVDYCGPFSIVSSHRRGVRPTKAYVAVFVCFATKATHLEIVGDLTTEACLNSLRRFVARRGIISHLHSDNGTNFVGCNNELKRIARLLSTTEIQAHLATLQIQWHFIPPRSPHFGGLWEAAVKSAKYHLKRVSKQTNLTIEEFSTILAQTEACLNSRPLMPSSDDHNDLGALTPGHFLIGQPLTALPEINLTDVPWNRLSRWQRVQQINQHFWSRWHKEYLSQLQTRTKWKQQHSPLKVGDLVVVREEKSPPLRWKLGRVLEVFCGADEVPRVVLIKTVSGTDKVSVKSLCQLPMEPKTQ